MKGLPLMFLPLLASAEITTSSISSKHATYDGNALILRGEVQLHHALGKMDAQVARLEREKAEEPFSSIRLSRDVHIHLAEQGEISCDQADFDFHAMTGTLLPKAKKQVQFFDQTKQVTLSSQIASIQFARDFDQLKVVKVEANPPCTVTHFDDVIEAEKILLYPDTETVVFESPTGQLKPTIFSETQAVNFSSDKLVWEQKPHTLTLTGHISIKEATMGEVEADQEVELCQKFQEGKWTLSNIYSKGKTKVTYGDHVLIADGGVHLDGDRLTLTIDRSEESPVEYRKEDTTLYADLGRLEYFQEQETIFPKKLMLLGGVRLTKQGDLRCAIADQVVYDSESEEMILSAKNGDRVLFWDQKESLSISAVEVHIGKTEQGEMVKGVGNVRFAFSSTESALLKKLFPFVGGHL